MYIKFINDYLAMKKGAVLNIEKPQAIRLIKNEIAKEIDENDFFKHLNSTKKAVIEIEDDATPSDVVAIIELSEELKKKKKKK